MTGSNPSSPPSTSSARNTPHQASDSDSDDRTEPDYRSQSTSESSASGILQTPSSKSEQGESSLSQTAKLIKSGKAKNIVILTGAGISTSAGIPDFRSPSTGLYHNLQRLNLPFPEAVFELGYFRKNPKPFWILAKELYPGKHFPTPTHYFFRLLNAHSLLRRIFTQNIDTLETIAGLPASRIIEAHGSFANAHCLDCEKEASQEYVLASGVRKGEVVRCGEEGCGGLVKPDIVFFGEGLPERFFKSLSDLKQCDLLIVIGTSLQVQPFAGLVNYVRPDVPRVLINREAVGPFGMSKRGGRDMFWQGDADDGVRRLVEELGWGDELENMIKERRRTLEQEWGTGMEGGGREAATKKAKEEAGQVKEAVGKYGVEDLQKAIERQLDLGPGADDKAKI